LPIRRIVFLRTDRLGETLLTLPAMAALKNGLPGSSITALVQADLKPLLEGASPVDEVLTYQPEGRRVWWHRAIDLARRLKSGQFDLAVVSNPMKELHVAVWLAGIRWRAGYDRKWGFLLTHRVRDCKALGERHEVEYNLDLVRVLGLPSSIPQWGYARLVQEQVEVRQLLEQQGIRPSDPFIAVHPWTSNPLKRWPPERYAALIQYAREQLAIQVVMIGGPEEAAESHSVLPPGVPVANLTGRLTLRQLAALLQCARLLVSNDSGPVHLAACVSTRTLVLFGTPNPANGPRRWGPWGDGHCVIWKPSMDDITIDEVSETLTQMLRGSE